ncbi:MAG: GNAT family N-acetyltransferase [Propionibacterium sp.]|nr:GNAT family N-acetyltransferase [Propionibacterium sp.]
MEQFDVTPSTDDTLPSAEELAELYDAVGWTAYTQDMDALLQGIRNSLHVVAARREGRLLGLARIVGDGFTICYLQDVLVHPDAQGIGVGRALVTAAFAPFSHVRQHVLITDEEAGQKAFYESLGFTQLGTDIPGRAFVRFSHR